jgi:uroporphyrinogen decarboxylase
MLENSRSDQIGACGWLHTPEVDRRSPKEFASRIIEMTDRSRWDFIKIMPNGVYIQEAHGADITYLSENIPPENLRAKQIMFFNKYLVNSAADMEAFPVLNAAENPVYQREAQVVKALAEHYRGTVPILPTIFTPAHTVPEFCGGIERARYYLDNHPDALGRMLQALLETMLQLLDVYIGAGADGFFIASRYSNADILSEAEFERFCRPYDEKILAHIKGRAWFNIMHVHGEKNFFWDQFREYDVQAFSWENTPLSVPEEQRSTVEKVRRVTDKILISGTDQFCDFYGTREEVKSRFRQRLERAVRECGDNRFVFAPGCSLPLDIEAENVHLLREAADEYNASAEKFN